MSSEKDTKAQGIHIYFSPLFLSQAKKKTYASIFIRLRIMDVHKIAYHTLLPFKTSFNCVKDQKHRLNYTEKR